MPIVSTHINGECPSAPCPVAPDALPSVSWEQLAAELTAAMAGVPPPPPIDGKRAYLEWTSTRLPQSPGTRSLTDKGLTENNSENRCPTPATAGLVDAAAPQIAAAAALFSTTTVRSDDVRLIEVRGPLGAATQGSLRKSIVEAIDEASQEAQIAVDLRRADFVDDDGCLPLHAACLSLSRQGRTLIFVTARASAGAAWLDRMTLDQLAIIVDSPAALKQLRTPSRHPTKRQRSPAKETAHKVR